MHINKTQTEVRNAQPTIDLDGCLLLKLQPISICTIIRDCHLLSACYVPGTVLNALYLLSS